MGKGPPASRPASAAGTRPGAEMGRLTNEYLHLAWRALTSGCEPYVTSNSFVQQVDRRNMSRVRSHTQTTTQKLYRSQGGFTPRSTDRSC